MGDRPAAPCGKYEDRPVLINIKTGPEGHAGGTDMPIQTLDHINIRTANLEPMIAWYRDILGLAPGPRPNFSFGGAWLYAGDTAIIHLVQVAEQPGMADQLQLEHFALAGTDKDGFVAKLAENDVTSRVNVLSDFGITQVNIYDPDGNHIHVDFRD